ncbi:AfsR/SARP family transcriptional regulator [Actinacidiphila alni]|uniref:AfsR/SARP family transcriptional regulator n=1 Tax=Actinacidiphila alni TaxID=380248 RepID=UPI000B82481B|nr:BTAD domain-containing putative transcriptional regulator [Actinacidiphila alni]
MRYVILGTTQALRDDGTPATLAGGRLRALLTALALRPGRVVTADALIDDVWDGDPPAGATGALQALIGRLRRALGHDAVGSVEGGYRLEAAPDDVDLYRFERLAEEGARALADGDPVKAAGLLGDALALWRGPALADLPDRGTAAVRSEALRRDAQRLRLTAELDLGRSGAVLPELAELAAAHPLDEPLRALHIRALRAAGRTADALAAYESVRRDLADQLGADPSPELRALHAELLNPGPLPGDSWPPAGPARGRGPGPGSREGRTPGGRTQNGRPSAGRGTSGRSGQGRDGAAPAADGSGHGAAAHPGGSRSAPGNGRVRLTSFVGREAELAAVRGDLERARLVTITGPGGTGKTRLSQETGDLVGGRWKDGVWYAELAPVSDPRTLPEAVISSLGLRETLLHAGGATEAALAVETKSKDPARQLADYCASRSLLLVLDNCEHVIDAAAALAEQLLAACPDVSVLATSREPLGVPGELVRPLDPLPDPTALRLLADRGAAARPGFSTEEDPVACAELCRRLDGLPLAIELAAARLRSLSPRQLADRLDDRFRLLTGGSRTLLPRQQTLRAVVDWSWDLLEPAERILLRRLAVFRGGWTLEAVEAVCADPSPAPPPGTPGAVPGPDRIDPLDAAALLSSLVDKSLVLAEVTDDGVRHRMLETIAEYAAERLDGSGERPAVERRHLTYFREYVRTADPMLRGGGGAGQLVWLERLEREHENLRAALRRAVELGDEQEALILVLSCSWFWEIRNYLSERRHWPKAVAALGPDPFAAPPALEPLDRGPLDDPPPLEGERLLEARRWVRIEDMASFEGESEWWQDPHLVAVGEALIATYPPHLPQSARFPGIMRPYGAFFSGDFERLHELMNQTVGSCRAHNRQWELAFALQLRAKINNDVTERLGDSLADIAESRRLFQRLGDEWGTAETLSAEAEAASNGGDWTHAAECCREGIALARKIGSHQHVPVLMVRMGEALYNAGQEEEGERLLREGVDSAELYIAAGEGAGFYGRVVLAGVLARRGALEEALGLVDEAVAVSAGGGAGVPGFIKGMLHAMRGFLIGKLGEPVTGLAMVTEGVEELIRHPLAHVITPRLAIMLAPGVVELLTDLATREDSATDGAGPRNEARARRAVLMLNANARLRPAVMPPAEKREMADAERRLRAYLTDAGFEAAYAEGDGISVEEAVALMRDVD